MSADPRVAAVVEALIREGAGPGASIHGWRCEHPDRYGPCDCVHETATEVVDALDAVDTRQLADLMVARYGKAPVLDALGVNPESAFDAICDLAEADLRERIARDLTSCACSKCEAAGRRLRGHGHTACGYWLSAARIARGDA